MGSLPTALQGCSFLHILEISCLLTTSLMSPRSKGTCTTKYIIAKFLLWDLPLKLVLSELWWQGTERNEWWLRNTLNLLYSVKFGGRWFYLWCSRWFVSSRTQILSLLPSLRSLASWLFVFRLITLWSKDGCYSSRRYNVVPVSQAGRKLLTQKLFSLRSCLLIQNMKVLQGIYLFVSMWRTKACSYLLLFTGEGD